MSHLSSPIGYFRKSAKTLTKQVRDVDRAALARVRAVYFNLREEKDADVASAFKLMWALHVVAVEHGFPKWNDLIVSSPVELHQAITRAKEPNMIKSRLEHKPPKDPETLATEAWRVLITHLKNIGWRVFTPRNREAYYRDHEGRYGTLRLCIYENTVEPVWRWYIDHYQLRRRVKLEMIDPERPLDGAGESKSTELTCAADQLAALAEWLPKWLVAYRGSQPLPAPPVQMEARHRESMPWRIGYGWTERAAKVYEASRVKTQPAQPRWA